MKLSSIICMACMTLVLAAGGESYNLLLAVPLESESIHHFYTKLSEHLVNANHSVTLISSYTSSFSHPNFRHINIMGDVELPLNSMFKLRDTIGAAGEIYHYVMFMAEQMWKNDKILNLWKERNSFDAFMLTAWFNEVAMPFMVNFTGEFILISNPGIEYFSTSYMGNWLPASVVPLIYLPFDEHMSFFQRTLNVIFLVAFDQYHSRVFVEGALASVRRKFPEMDNFQSYYEKASLTLINGAAAMDNPVPLLPNQVEIGTFMAQPAQPLPQDLESYMSSSGEHGVIYFSIGSAARSTDIPKKAKNEFVEAFRRLPQKVIWKYEGDDLEVPSNVLVRSWLPQQDILGHPKTRVFISQGGIMSTHELMYHGVPALMVPIIMDQYRNAARLEHKKLGIQLDWDTLTADSIVDSINALVNDTSYSERLKTLSAVLKDQKESPAERAVWWIEYVIRHKGAPHLHYPGKKLHFLQYFCVDVLLFLAVCLYVAYRLFKIIIARILRPCFGKTTKPKVKKQ